MVVSGVLTFVAIEPGKHKAPGVFAVQTLSRDQGAVAKAAGFWFHGGSCRPGCAACAAGLGLPQGWGKPAWWFRPADSLGFACAEKLADKADDAALAQLRATQATVEASRATDAVIEIPCPQGRAFYGYQRAGIAFALARQNTLLGDEMGLGKTPQAIGVYAVERMGNSAATMLVVCPASLRINWLRELCAWLTMPTVIHVVDSSWKLPKSFDAGIHTATVGPWIQPTAQVVVINYERLREPAMVATLAQRQWTILAADEAHYLKNPKSLRAKAVLGARADRKSGKPAQPGMIEYAARRLFLTGTPLPNRPKELHPLLSVLAPAEFGNFFAFAKRYCGAFQQYVPGVGEVWNFDGASHLDELQHRMRATCMIRRLKADVLTELPAKVRQLVVLPTEGRAAAVVSREVKAWEEYEERLEELQSEVDLAHASGDATAYERAVVALEKASKVAFEEMASSRRDTAIAKLPLVIEHVRAMLEGGVEKVSIWGHHVESVLEPLAAEFADMGAVKIHGGVSMADRDAAVQRFQNDPTCRVFVGGITAAGVGLTLTAGHHAVFAELDWVPANVSQAEDRHHRIGQTDTVFIQHLVLDGSLDQRMATTLIAKQAIADSALDRKLVRLAMPEATALPPAYVPPVRPVDPMRDLLAEPVLPVGRHLGVERPLVYPVPTEEQREVAKLAMLRLANMCDGAVTEDFAGFSKCDTRAGKLMATRARPLTDGETWLATVFARRYRRQLGREVLVTLRVVEGE